MSKLPVVDNTCIIIFDIKNSKKFLNKNNPKIEKIRLNHQGAKKTESIKNISKKTLFTVN